MANITRRSDGPWRDRDRDRDRAAGGGGEEPARHLARDVDAQPWLDEVTASAVTGMYVDPEAGQVTLSACYAPWATRHAWAPGTELARSLAMRTATFDDVERRLLRRSHVESWMTQMTAAGLAPLPPKTGAPSSSPAAPSAALRLGAAALRVGDVDFRRCRVVVSRQVEGGADGTVEVRAPEHGSERTVVVPDRLLTLNAGHVERHSGIGGPERWLFPPRPALRRTRTPSATGGARRRQRAA